MHRTTIAVPDDLFHRAERKASAEGLSLPEVLRRLLAQWVSGEALSSFGMWSDRDPDALLQASRRGLEDRDRELADARLDPR